MWIHVAKHQHFLALVILQDRRNQSALFFKCQFHKSLPKNKNPAAQSAPRGISCLNVAESLGRAPRARQMAVMMMVSMRPKSHLVRKVQECGDACQSEDCRETIQELDARCG